MARRFPEGDKASRAFPDGSKTARLYPAGTKVKRNFPVEEAAAGGDESDDFLDACKAEDSLYGLWTCKTQDEGELANGNTVMTDLSGNDRAVINVVLSDTGNWQIESENGPGGKSPSLVKWVSTDEDDQGDSPTNYAAVADTIAPVSSDTQSCSGFVIYKMPSFFQRFEIAHYRGTTSAPTGTSGTAPLLLNTYGTKLQAVNSDGGTNFNPGTSGDSGTQDTQAGHWTFWAWTLTYDGSNFDYACWIQRCGSAWDTNQTSWTYDNQIIPATLKNGLRFGYGSTEGNVVAGTGWAAHALFSSPLGEDDFKTIYEAAGLQG
jgi:hypothetical protein